MCSTVGRQLLVTRSRSSCQPPNVTFNSPSPFIPFFPPEEFTAKVHLELTLALDANRRKDIICLSGKVDPTEGVRQTDSVVRVEEISCGELVATSNGVTGRDGGQRGLGVVVTPAIWIFEELAEVVKMQPCTKTVPAWKAPFGIRPGGST